MASKKPVTWNGIEYESLAEAARALDIAPISLRYRIEKGYTSDDDLVPGKLSQQVRDEIVKLHKKGLKREAIAAKVGISLPTVRKALALEGFGEDIRKGDYGKEESTPEEKERFIELYNQGYTAQQASEMVGYHKRWGLSVLSEYADQVKPVHSDVSQELFIKLWQHAQSLDDLAEQINHSKANILARAQRLKNRGVPLKLLRSRKGRDWDELALYAAMLLVEDE